jgi:deoxyxylulose-5-phosphate synthase
MTGPSETYPLLSSLHCPADLRGLPTSTLSTLATELREFLIRSVSLRGGHFAAGLGTVELTIALHYVFDTPHDRRHRALVTLEENAVAGGAGNAVGEMLALPRRAAASPATGYPRPIH